VSDAAAYAWRQFRLERRMFWRNPTAAFFSFLLPLIFVVVLGAVFSGDQENLDLIIPGVAGMNIMATTFTALAMSLTFLREQGVLKRMRGTPLPPGAYLVGIVSNAVVNAAVQIAIVIVAGKLFFGLPWPVDWIELIVFAALGVASFAALGVAFSHVIPNFDAAPAYVNVVFLPTILIGGVFFDPANSTAVLTDIARVLPISHLVEGLREAMVGGAGIGDNAGGLVVLALWGAVGLFFAVRGFSWDQKRS
jgi:ABC-2 type transport system permease protein